MRKEKQTVAKKIIWILVIAGSLLAAVSKIFVGFDIDEGYALALPYRLLQGDRLFSQMWEVHQTSSIFAALILYPFLAAAKAATGLVLYVRIVCSVVHLFVSLCVYRTVRLFVQKEQAGFLAAVYFNFLPKWMMTADFSMQFTWFYTICILCLMCAQYHVNRQEEKVSDRSFLFAMLVCGVSLAFLVLGYPTMVLLYPLFLLLILLRKEWGKGKRWKAALCLTAGCGIPAIVFLGYLLSYMKVPELLQNLSNVFSDGSHQFSGTAKWSLWVGHGRDVLLQTVITLVPAAVIAALLQLVLKAYGAKQGSRGERQSADAEKKSFPLLLVCVYTFLTSALVAGANVIGIAWGPFRLQIRYLILFAFGFLLAGKGSEAEKKKWIREICLVSSLVTFAGILLASNVGPTSSSSYLVVGVMAALWLVMTNMSEIQSKIPDSPKKPLFFIEKLTLLFFLISIMMCKGYYVRVTEYPPSNILMERKQIAEGPAKGIYVYPSEHREMTETYEMIRRYTGEADQVLYLGTQALSNLYTDGRIVLPTTISTPAFNEQWIAYFEQNPDKMPTIIFLSKTTVENQEKFFSKNPFGVWLASHYDVENRIDTEYLCIIREKVQLESP
ncbi:MAG: hypothetical protein IJ711_11505 [Lachnospiraceae bacterium]|nr:hypothetical protein [Lachnospiraceae bacterium]